jgi:DNA-binding NtrC family response regulator/tRNA A-37 threonylcarbamoyl transferase component Bud32
MSARILIVDDTPANIQMLAAILREQGYQLSAATNGRQAVEAVEKVRPDLVLMDVVMPDMDGYEACRQIKASTRWRDLPIIFLTAKTEPADIVRGFDAGAVDYVGKPFNGRELLARVSTHLTLQRLHREMEGRNAELARELEVAQELLTDARRRVDGALLGDSPAIRALRESISRHAADAEPVLLTGAPGAGPEATARAIHHSSPRSRHAFIHVNGALLPPGDSGILTPRPKATAAGTADGVSPDAGSRPSLLDLSAGGTLYLEEVQRLPGEVQEGLATVLELARAARERGEAADPDVRVIAYTSAPLSTASGFHTKLLVQLEPRQLRVPSLAERSEDVPELALFFVHQHVRRIGAVVETIGEESLKRLRKYRWPGDLGELQSLVERAVTSAREPVLEIDAAQLDEGVPLGLYRLMEKLGEGGMGEVWRARHLLLARPCAVKVIRPDRLGESSREKTVERFRLEAKAIARLSSQNTVRLFDFGVTETGSLYFVMELLEGLDLASLVQRFGPLPAERAVAVLRQACRSLGEAHAAGLLHRDIKPHNLYLCRLGLDVDVVKVLDFGLVKSLREGNADLTTDGILTGTPAYMPPERVQGVDADERSDIYALGCVAYWMLTGRTVFAGEPMAMMLHHVRTAPQPPSKSAPGPVPERLDQIVLACLEKAPEQRPPSAIDLWHQLGEVTVATPWTAERAENWWRQHLPADAGPRGRDGTGTLSLTPFDGLSS